MFGSLEHTYLKTAAVICPAEWRCPCRQSCGSISHVCAIGSLKQTPHRGKSQILFQV